MALDLTGINNVNEFYSHHYLDALLENDIKSLLQRWDAAEEESSEHQAPYKSLAGCSEAYFKAKARATDTTSDDDRFEETHPINVRLLEALGYEYQSNAFSFIDDKEIVPVLTHLKRDGNPYLWAVEAPFPKATTSDDVATLEQILLPRQKPVDAFEYNMPNVAWEKVISLIFRQEEPPRWVMLFAGSELYLFERHKWGQGKYLLFDIDELLGRKSMPAIKAAAALLSRDALCPAEGSILHDTLDENSHKHAYAVSGDLKYGVRKAVELLANEYVWYQRNVAKQALFQDEDLARKLTTECLTYLYRLLFLFYAEARDAEIGIVEMKSDEYREGYSLESLRDLELMPLTTDAAQKGYFLDTSLRKLFKIVNEGFNKDAVFLPFDPHAEHTSARADDHSDNRTASPTTQWLDHGFSIQGLESPLFDMKRTPMLTGVRLRNVVLQEVIQLLSLSREGGRGNRRRERGRISYAELGINQLGAVYEGLLSYSGFFASEPLYEVKPAGAAATDETEQSYFVPESQISKYTNDEIVHEEIPGTEGAGGETTLRRKRYEKGAFIYRLAGRDREKSASYYTPECLTQCVVKYSLKELLKEKSADDILALSICEPAMGSGAFLNEAINQLADAYLERKQAETGASIPPGEFPLERQKVKAYLATHNCYGVDRNPIATELAKVSLWLNTIYRGSRCPWFGLRLAVGNSLIGARRQVYDAKDLKRKNAKDNPNWLGLVPKSLPLGPTWEPRLRDAIYHFLLPHEGMAAFDSDKVIKQLAKSEADEIKSWRKDFCRPFDKHEIETLKSLSAAVDDLWQQVIKERKTASQRTNQPIDVWGQAKTPRSFMSMGAQEKVAEELERPYTAYRRLKLVMDYWCSLWFWPIDEARRLPSRDAFLLDIELILKGTATGGLPDGTLEGLFPGEEISPEHRALLKEYGYVDVDKLCQTGRYQVVRDVADRIRFHHWELRFADLFAERGGFDLIVGNPPWVKVEWNEGGYLSDLEPSLAIRNVSASDIAGQRTELLNSPSNISGYLSEIVEQHGSKNFLNAEINYPYLKGVQTNLYKCFVTKGWEIGSGGGVVGLLHPEGIYDDPKGGVLRAEVYPRLRGHFQFINDLKLFAEIGHKNKYSINIYSSHRLSVIGCNHISNLFHPITIVNSDPHDGEGFVPGIKTEDDQWDLRPHKSRIVVINRDRLAIFARLYDESGTPPERARLPVVHSEELVRVLEKFAEQPRRLGDIEDQYYSTVMFDETYAQRDGTIRRETRYPKDAHEWILSGPHFHVGTPLNKTPNEGCSSHGDYTPIDLTAIPDSYLPRTNYVPACSSAEYLKRTPKFNGRPVTEYYRHVHREMVSPTGERTLVPTLIPPGAGHVNTLFAVVFADDSNLLIYNALASTIVYDFFIKTTGMGHVNINLATALPLPNLPSGHRTKLIEHILKLVCLTTHYRDLWNNVFEGRPWSRNVALRTDASRRIALVNLDVLAALALNLTIEELLTIYRVQFPVLREYERSRRYDQTGRLVPESVLKLAAQHNIDIHEPLNLATYRGPAELVGEIDTLTLGPTGGIVWEDPKMEPRMTRVYPPPFTKCDREADMRQAYETFQKQLRREEVVTQ